MNTIRLMCGIALATALAACGQKGPLYLPDQAGGVVTRPTQTPEQAPAPPSPSSQEAPPLPEAPSSPQTVDSPEGQASPAPEVVLPKPDETAEAEKRKQEAAKPR